MGKFCHRTVPEVPKSSSNSLLIHLYAGSYHNPSRKGFEASYTCEDVEVIAPLIVSPEAPSEIPTVVPSELPSQPQQCGKTLFTGSSGTIASPNWPETYPTDIQCSYFIQAPSECKTVEITFNDGFGIAGSYPSCSIDWIKIYDGHTDDAFLHGKYCHFHKPPVIVTSGSKAKIVLYAGPNHSPSRKGFEASYTCKDVEVIAPSVVPSEVPSEIPSEVPSELPPQPQQCGKTLFTESSGTIASPNWPETYPTDIQCSYFIQAPSEGSTIEITFNDDFGIAGSYPTCNLDWVKIYDGHTDDAFLHGEYCHFHKPPVIQTSGSKAKIVLYAGPRHSPSRRGFTASYRTI